MIEGVCAVAVWCVMGMVMNDPIRSIVIVIRGAKFDQRLDVNQRTSINRSTTTSWTMIIILSTLDHMD